MNKVWDIIIRFLVKLSYKFEFDFIKIIDAFILILLLGMRDPILYGENRFLIYTSF